MKELVIVENDRVGLLSQIAEALGKADVNIESLSADVIGEKAIIRLIVNDEKKGNEALVKAGFKPVASDTIVVTLEDAPGELSKVTRILSDANINLTNAYLLGKDKGKTLVAIKVEKKYYEKARKLLKDYL